jgi:hypothetical protein
MAMRVVGAADHLHGGNVTMRARRRQLTGDSATVTRITNMRVALTSHHGSFASADFVSFGTAPALHSGVELV